MTKRPEPTREPHPRRIRVGVIFGGRSGEHEVSLASAASVLSAIDPARYEVVPMGIAKDGQWVVGGDPLRALAEAAGVPVALPPAPAGPDGRASEALARVPTAGGLPAGVAARLDVVFPVIHGPYGEDGTLQGLLELADVPYVGAGVLASAVGMDKATMKAVFRAHGLPVVPHVVLRDHEWAAEPGAWRRRVADELGYPCFVKPANLGSSVGISKVTAARALDAAIDAAFAHDRKILVERGIAGREIEVSVLGNDTPEASVPGEILPGREWYDYEAKYTDGVAKLLIPAPLSPGLAAEFRRLAVARVPRDRRGGARARRLLSRHRRADLGERDQHDPGLHALLGLPAALGSERPVLSRAGRPPDRARPRAPRPEAAARLTGAPRARAGCGRIARPVAATRRRRPRRGP